VVNNKTAPSGAVFLAAAATGRRNSKREWVFQFKADLPPRALVDVSRKTIDEIRLEVHGAGVRPMVHK
jgi:hypothetical protein